MCIMPLTRAALGSPAERAALGGKYYPPPLLTKKRRAIEIHGRRQSKARNEKLQMSGYFFNPRPAGPLDFPPPAGGGLRTPSISAPGPRSDTR